MQIKNLVIEKGLKNCLTDKRLTVTINWDQSNPVGTAIARYDDKMELVADITFADRMIPEEIVGLYPAIGFRTEGDFSNLFNLSFCSGKNEDETIQPVTIEDFYVPFDDQPVRHWMVTVGKRLNVSLGEVTYNTITIETHPNLYLKSLINPGSAYTHFLVYSQEISEFDYKLYFH